MTGANQIVAPSYSIQGTSYADVASAFTAVDNALGTGNPYAAVNSTGRVAQATGTNAMAFGSGANATQTNSIAFGTNAQATGANAIAIGSGATATGSVAVGNNAVASNGGAAFGDNATATGTNSTAVGPGATATHANSAAFGNGATTTRANQHVYGTASNTHTVPGRADKALTGVAMAFAMAGVPTLLPHEKMAATLNMGTYQGSQGFAINAAWRVAERASHRRRAAPRSPARRRSSPPTAPAISPPRRCRTWASPRRPTSPRSTAASTGCNVQVNGGIGYGPDQNIVGGRAGLRVGW